MKKALVPRTPHFSGPRGARTSFKVTLALYSSVRGSGGGSSSRSKPCSRSGSFPRAKNERQKSDLQILST